MASASFGFLSLATLLIAGTLVLRDHSVSAQCENSFPDLTSQCFQFVLIPGPKVPPNQACCDVVKNVDIPCICKHVTKDVEKLVSMEKVVYVARSCSLNVPPGMQCGSYTAPPA